MPHSNSLAAISADTDAICRPFFLETGVNAFSYSRFHEDGTRAELWSNFSALEHTFFTARYVVGAFTPQYYGEHEPCTLMSEKVKTYPKEIQERFRQQLVDQREYFNHDHCLVMVDRSLDLSEYFCFYMPRTTETAISFYLSNVDKLKAFSKYFVTAAKDLVAGADQARIVNIREGENNEWEARHAGAEAPKRQRPWEQLTPREREVAQAILMGSTMKEVGGILDISARTVERHIENIKLKMNCHRRSDLVKRLAGDSAFLYNK